MILTAVVDTNVVAAGLITHQADSAAGRVLDGMLAASFPFALSVGLLAEYRTVLNRRSLQQCHGLAEAEVESLLLALAQHAIALEPGSGPTAPDPGDQFLWNLLASHEALCLVTGDKLLLQHQPAPAPVLLPAEFIQRVDGSKVQDTGHGQEA